MGYYSDVAIAVIKEKAKGMHEIITKHSFFPEDDLVVGDWNIFLWEDTKWYEDDLYFSFPEIEEISNFLKNLSPDEFSFIRIGEEFGDIEARGDGNAPIFAEAKIRIYRE